MLVLLHSELYPSSSSPSSSFSSLRVFTFGIGSGASTALVNGLARAGNGSAEFIKEDERMQPKVSEREENKTLLLFHCFR